MTTRDARRTGGRQGMAKSSPREKTQDREESARETGAGPEPDAQQEDWAHQATANAAAAIEEARQRASEAARIHAEGQRGVQNAAEIAALAFSSYHSVLAEATTLAQQMAQTAFTAWRDFAGVRSPAELLEVQTRLARTQTEQVMEFTRRIADLLTATAERASGRESGKADRRR